MDTSTRSATAAHRPADPAAAEVWDIAATVCDPEIPVLTIEDLGILRDARVGPGPAGTAPPLSSRPPIRAARRWTPSATTSSAP
jgi:ring-1,2-phenylacetyl-CoA epoxidase subunit PaaD